MKKGDVPVSNAYVEHGRMDDGWSEDRKSRHSWNASGARSHCDG
ncbi:hypothetical protein PI125_g18444 [Phytophthora idaei]|nr:hypothetical protein PI125_g18444 [Phytophthora idaei]